MHELFSIVLCLVCTLSTCIEASIIPLHRAPIVARQAVASAPVTSGGSAPVSSTTSRLTTLPTAVGITSNGTNAVVNKLQVQNATSVVATPSGSSDSAIASSCLNNDISTVTESWQSYTVCLYGLSREHWSLTCLRKGHGLHDKPPVCSST